MDGELRAIFRKHLAMVDWSSIESATTEPGIPDLNGCYAGCEFWIENKLTEGWAVNIRSDQIGWHLKRTRYGGRTFVAVRRHRTRKRDELYLVRGVNIVRLYERGLAGTPQEGVWYGGPANWSWREILEVLTKTPPA